MSGSGDVESLAGSGSGGHVSRVADRSLRLFPRRGSVPAVWRVAASGGCCGASGTGSGVGELGGWKGTSRCFSERGGAEDVVGVWRGGEGGLRSVSLEGGVHDGDWVVEELEAEWVVWMSCASVVSGGLDREAEGRAFDLLDGFLSRTRRA